MIPLRLAFAVQIALTMGLLMLMCGPRLAYAHGGELWEVADVVEAILIDRAAAHGANLAEVMTVARCENPRFDPSAVGGHGERGIGQWLPGRGNHWDRTPAWREQRIDVVAMYRAGHPDALWVDLDQFVWSFSPEAQQLYPNNKAGWSCWRVNRWRF